MTVIFIDFLFGLHGPSLWLKSVKWKKWPTYLFFNYSSKNAKWGRMCNGWKCVFWNMGQIWPQIWHNFDSNPKLAGSLFLLNMGVIYLDVLKCHWKAIVLNHDQFDISGLGRRCDVKPLQRCCASHTESAWQSCSWHHLGVADIVRRNEDRELLDPPGIKKFKKRIWQKWPKLVLFCKQIFPRARPRGWPFCIRTIAQGNRSGPRAVFGFGFIAVNFFKVLFLYLMCH